MKQILLIGASGYIGSNILKEALYRGHKVTAVVRDAAKISIQNPNLTIKEADVSSIETVKQLSTGMDAVISAYNPGWNNPNIYNDTLRIYPIILEGVKQAGVKRLLIVGGAASLFVSPGLRLIDTGDVPEKFYPGAKSLTEFYLNTLIPEKDIDWVLLSPAQNIVPGSRTGIFRLGKDDTIFDSKGNSNISVEDFALAMIDELEKPHHHKERFTIGY